MATMTEQVKSYAANLTTAALAEVTQDEPMVDPETGEIIEPLSEQLKLSCSSLGGETLSGNCKECKDYEYRL